MIATTRFLMIGGFLGAGKTTMIARLAHHYLDQGLKVGLVTNDQAYGLVDTQSLRAQGFRVGEVPGACFCCKFDELTATAAQLAEKERPDVIISEPVGSCTDLVATVIEPLRQLHGRDYEMAPLAVLCKPEHGRKILGGADQVGFSSKAAYIFLKQLEEADLIVVNKRDLLTEQQATDLVDLVEARFPDATVLLVSGKTGDGFDALVEAIDEPAPAHANLMSVDYDTYAEGEAELGWLNATFRFESIDERAVFSLDEVVMQLVERLALALSAAGIEPAHLKVLGASGASTAVANLVSSDRPAELSISADVQVGSAHLVVNARVAGDPDQLAAMVDRAIAELGGDSGLRWELGSHQHFRPGRPEPTHRVVR